MNEIDEEHDEEEGLGMDERRYGPMKDESVLTDLGGQALFVANGGFLSFRIQEDCNKPQHNPRVRLFKDRHHTSIPYTRNQALSGGPSPKIRGTYGYTLAPEIQTRATKCDVNIINYHESSD
ncbi:Uncharacterized protein Adt_26634 [Abeliophyllum distichum]|uniref:Uncharacterized protein n=1 Tax=Abeliophyllum distichum TaxID=126358 RepID=A0ABD1RRR0_9LAMI